MEKLWTQEDTYIYGDFVPVPCQRGLPPYKFPASTQLPTSCRVSEAIVYPEVERMANSLLGDDRKAAPTISPSLGSRRPESRLFT